MGWEKGVKEPRISASFSMLLFQNESPNERGWMEEVAKHLRSIANIRNPWDFSPMMSLHSH